MSEIPIRDFAVVEPHPAAELFPMMNDTEIKDLAEVDGQLVMDAPAFRKQEAA